MLHRNLRKIKFVDESICGGAFPKKWRQKRGRGGRGVWGEFRRARAFRRSEAEAVSSLQKMFEQSCIIPRARSSAVEHFVYTEGVVGSNPAARTI